MARATDQRAPGTVEGRGTQGQKAAKRAGRRRFAIYEPAAHRYVLARANRLWGGGWAVGGRRVGKRVCERKRQRERRPEALCASRRARPGRCEITASSCSGDVAAAKVRTAPWDRRCAFCAGAGSPARAGGRRWSHWRRSGARSQDARNHASAFCLGAADLSGHESRRLSGVAALALSDSHVAPAAVHRARWVEAANEALDCACSQHRAVPVLRGRAAVLRKFSI